MGPYQYSIDNRLPPTWQNTGDFIGLAPGEYTTTVKDLTTGGMAIQPVHLTSGCLTANVVVKNATCGINNGVITITAANGTAPYRYSINGVNFQSSNVFNDLSPGSYIITVIDNIGIKITVKAEVANEPGASIKILSTNSDCDLHNGILTITHTGGTPPLIYSTDTTHFKLDSVFTNLYPGSYTGYVKDSNGCLTQSGKVFIYNLCVRFDLEVKKSSCGQSSGSVTVYVTSGVPPFLYSINGGAYQTSNIFSNLDSGMYVITVKDSTNRIASNNAEIITTVPPQIKLVALPASCSNNDGIILASVKNGVAPFLYGINNSSFSPDSNFRSLPIGNYTITVKDSLSCTASTYISVPLKDNAKLFAGNDTNAVINHPIQLNAIDVNNSGFTSYIWSPSTGLSNPDIANPIGILNNNITYTVIASNSIGCKASDVITIKVYRGPEIYVPTAFTPNNDGINDRLKPIPVGIKNFLFFEIYDRWGQKIFYTNDANKGWDGNIKGSHTSQSTYVWFTQGYDFEGKLVKRKGTVTLIY